MLAAAASAIIPAKITSPLRSKYIPLVYTLSNGMCNRAAKTPRTL